MRRVLSMEQLIKHLVMLFLKTFVLIWKLTFVKIQPSINDPKKSI